MIRFIREIVPGLNDYHCECKLGFNDKIYHFKVLAKNEDEAVEKKRKNPRKESP